LELIHGGVLSFELTKIVLDLRRKVKGLVQAVKMLVETQDRIIEQQNAIRESFMGAREEGKFYVQSARAMKGCQSYLATTKNSVYTASRDVRNDLAPTRTLRLNTLMSLRLHSLTFRHSGILAGRILL